MFSGSLLTFVPMTPAPFAYVTVECAMTDIGKVIGDAFRTLDAALEQAKTKPAGPPMARYRQFGSGRVIMDLGFPVQESMLTSLRAAGLQTGMTGGGQALRAIHTGPYDKLRLTYDAMLEAIAAAGREPADEMWERYLSSPTAPAEEMRTEVLWPVKPAPASYE